MSTATASAARSASRCTPTGPASRSSTSTSRARPATARCRTSCCASATRAAAAPGAGPAPIPDRRPREPQRRPDRVRARRQALRRDRRRRRGPWHRPGLSTDEPRGKILRLNPDGSVPAHEPLRRQPALVVRPSQLDRLRVRPADRATCGRPRTAPMQRRDEPDREGRQLRVGAEQAVRDAPHRGHEPGRPRPQAAARVVVRRDDRDHRRRVLRRMRAGRRYDGDLSSAAPTATARPPSGRSRTST